MSEFDKWWEENYMSVSSDRTEAEEIYNLGVESQQAKIDEALIEMKNQLGDEDYDNLERPDYDAMLYALRNIKDILKGSQDD